MTTERLYFQDAYQQALESTRIIARQELDGRPAVALAQTVFYATGGGQPHDLGMLNDVAVLNVIKGDDDLIWHVLVHDVDADTASGSIDWGRRFDFMQHHTGQHILSRAFEVLFDANTVGFHLSENSVTIDLDRDDLSVEMVAEAEALANQIVIQNVSVKAWFPDADTLDGLPLRKISDKVTGAVRVVQVGDFDVCACGGTHVAATGEIGIIKVVRQERAKQQTRIEFMCGGRALADYRLKNQFLLDMSQQFTTGWQDVPAMVERLRDENKSLSKSLKAAQQALMGYQATELWQAADHAQSPIMIVAVVDDATMTDLQQIARSLIEHSGTIALLGTHGDTAQLVFARSDDLDDVDVVPILKTSLAALGTQRGGGRPNMAQGGGVAASRTAVEAVLATATKTLRDR